MHSKNFIFIAHKKIQTVLDSETDLGVQWVKTLIPKNSERFKMFIILILIFIISFFHIHLFIHDIAIFCMQI